MAEGESHRIRVGLRPQGEPLAVAGNFYPGHSWAVGREQSGRRVPLSAGLYKELMEPRGRGGGQVS